MIWCIALLFTVGASLRMDDPIGLFLLAAAQFAMAFIDPALEPPHAR